MDNHSCAHGHALARDNPQYGANDDVQRSIVSSLPHGKLCKSELGSPHPADARSKVILCQVKYTTNVSWEPGCPMRILKSNCLNLGDRSEQRMTLTHTEAGLKGQTGIYNLTYTYLCNS
jgi:hypothetical protein